MHVIRLCGVRHGPLPRSRTTRTLELEAMARKSASPTSTPDVIPLLISDWNGVASVACSGQSQAAIPDGLSHLGKAGIRDACDANPYMSLCTPAPP